MTASELLHTCIDTAGGISRLARMSGIPQSTIYDWDRGAEPRFSDLLKCAASVGIELVTQQAASLPLGDDPNAEALRIVEARYNGFKAVEVRRGIAGRYPSGALVVAYDIMPLGGERGYDIDGNIVETAHSYRNRLTIYDGEGRHFKGYYCF